jgi:hypothetical protein
MNCRIFKKVVIPLAHHQLMDALMREQGLLHSEVCSDCALRLNEERALTAGVRAAAAEIALQEAPAHLEATLLNAFREQNGLRAKPADLSVMRLRPPGSGRQLRALAAGIVLLISLVATVWLQQSWLKRPAKQLALSQPTPLPAEPQTPSPLPAREVITQKEVLQATNAVPHRRPRRQRAAQSLPEVEVVTEFFPLLEGDDLNTVESGQIVRVELLGSALLAVGLPIDAALADEPVKADVILGHDGQARAIRFVR